ncbi:MAG: DUF4838 domain-containing protein, partial [Kiritimatiellae bacterium]|nr:DUF4838 domain-containing protein [Kiritimatiellia bacterium]
ERHGKQEMAMRLRNTTMVGLVVSLVLARYGTAEARTLTLTRDGQPTAVIVLAEQPTRAAQFAAYELQWHVRQMTGATLPIEGSGGGIQGSGKTVRIHVGDTPSARALGLTQEALGLQEYAVRAEKDALVLVGKDAADFTVVKLDPGALGDGGKNANWPGWWQERGTLHAVYDFLQDACGVRWFNPTDEGALIPKRPELTVRVKNVRRAPTFRYRDTGITWAEERYDRAVSLWGPKMEAGFKTWDALAYADSRARHGDGLTLRRNTATLFLLRMRNGGEKCVANHSLYHYYFQYWKPHADAVVSNYFVGQRPDWFAQGYESDPPPQLCYSSTGLIAQVAQEARDYFDKGGYPFTMGPTGYRWGENFFCVEPMDNRSFCKCPACTATVTKGTNYGTGRFFSTGIDSDYMFGFVDAVARKVKLTHPDRRIVTLAYASHAWPPRDFTLDPFVAVQFCFAFDGSPWWTEPYGEEWRLAEVWGREARRSGRALYAWCYYGHGYRGWADSGNFHCFPGYFAHAIGKELRMYKRHGYRGMFHCGMPTDVDSYVLFRLMDNADLDVDTLLDEYFTGLYGAAAKPLRKLYRLIEKTYTDPALRSHDPRPEDPKTFGLSFEVAWGKLGTEERMREFERLMNEARRLASTDREKRNVALLDLGLMAYMREGRAKYLADRSRETGATGTRPAAIDKAMGQ